MPYFLATIGNWTATLRGMPRVCFRVRSKRSRARDGPERGKLVHCHRNSTEIQPHPHHFRIRCMMRLAAAIAEPNITNILIKMLSGRRRIAAYKNDALKTIKPPKRTGVLSSHSISVLAIFNLYKKCRRRRTKPLQQDLLLLQFRSRSCPLELPRR